jgi:hypothetical protein
MPALITPEQAAQEILAGWQRGRFEIHFPKRFTRWMKTLQLLPYRMYFAIIRRFTGPMKDAVARIEVFFAALGPLTCPAWVRSTHDDAVLQGPVQ